MINGPDYPDEGSILREQEAAEQRVVAEFCAIDAEDLNGGYRADLEPARPDAIECARCGIELGDGRDKCRRAVGTDVCMDCIIDLDPPCEPDDRGAPLEESPSFRDAMYDSGRWP